MKIKLNDNFSFLSERYLFSEINARVEKYNNSQDKNEFNYLKLEANYIQTPPVF